MKLKATCDQCGKIFRVKFGIGKEGGASEIEVTYLQCPYCEKKYISHVTDKHIRALQGEIARQLREIRIAAKEDKDRLKTEKDKLDNLIKVNRKRMQILVEEYLKGSEKSEFDNYSDYSDIL